MPATVTYDAAIICEQVRPELNGKMILVGVISGDLAMTSFPTPMQIAVYAEGTVLEAGEFLSVSRVIDENGAVLFQGSPDPVKHFYLGRFAHLMFMTPQIPHPMTISIIANVNGQDHKLLSRNVTINAPPFIPPELAR